MPADGGHFKTPLFIIGLPKTFTINSDDYEYLTQNQNFLMIIYPKNGNNTQINQFSMIELN